MILGTAERRRQIRQRPGPDPGDEYLPAVHLGHDPPTEHAPGRHLKVEASYRLPIAVERDRPGLVARLLPGLRHTAPAAPDIAAPDGREPAAGRDAQRGGLDDQALGDGLSFAIVVQGIASLIAA